MAYEQRIDMRDMMGRVSIVVTVVGVRRARIRLWFGMQIMALGARVTGCEVIVKDETVEPAAIPTGRPPVPPPTPPGTIPPARPTR